MHSASPDLCERVLVKAPFHFTRDQLPIQPADADYVVRVDVCGLCKSDLHAAQNWASDWQEVGHEFGGTIVSARQDDGRFAVGDRVAVRNASACGECGRCLAGIPRRCERLVVNMQGFRDYAVCDERSLADASGLDDDGLGLVEPTNVALDLLHASDLQASHRVTVIGAGTLGLMTAYFAQHVFNVPEVVVLGRAASSPLASAIGINEYASFDGNTPAARRHADRVIVTTPPSTLDRALALLRPGGTVITGGLDSFDRCRVKIDVDKLIFGQHTLKGVCAAPNQHFDEAIALLRRHSVVLRRLISLRVSRRNIESTLEAWGGRVHYGGKTIVLRDGVAH